MIIIYAMNFTLKIDLLGFSQFLPVSPYLSGQNLSEWMKTIWVDETYLSGRNLSQWKKPIWVDVHSDGFRPLI